MVSAAPAGLEGIRVLEVAGGFGAAWVGKLFADIGADVIRFDDGGDRVRSRPHHVDRWINANKRSATTDFAALVAEADIVVHDNAPQPAADRGLAYTDLATLGSPGLVVASVTPYGMTGPYAGYHAEELNLIHASSWGYLSPAAATDETLPPLKAPGHHASILVANVAAAATLAAFDRAERTGVGTLVDFSSFAAAAKMTETAPAGASFLGTDASRLGTKTIEPWAIYRCADGLMHVMCVEAAQWEALLDLMGRPDWSELDVFATNEGRQENADLLHLYIGEWMAEQHVDDLYRRAQAARISCTPVNTMAQISLDAQLEARGFFAETPDGLRVPGPGFQTDQGWWGLRRSSPTLGEHDGEGWLERENPPEIAAPPGAATTRPLDGVRVCDFTWVWAGPFCTQYLAHLGADVIRLESEDRSCLFRRLPFNPPELPLGPDTAGVFQSYNSDKRSMAIDLRHPDAADIVRRLVAKSDVVIDNFGVGVMADLGFGVDDLRAINPDVIVASLSGYGQTGPSAGYMAYGPAGGSFSGLYAANGYEGGAATETGIAVGDPGTGITAAWSIVAALVARRRTGAVARIDVAMVEAIASTLGEVWMEYETEGTTPARRGNRDAVVAPHNCYPTAAADEWLTIACPGDEAWRSLAALVNPSTVDRSLVDDVRFATMALRKQNEVELDEIITAWTTTGDRWDLTQRLQAAGVAAMPSISPLELWRGDPQMTALDMLERPDHPVTGRYVVAGVPWKLSNTPNGLRAPAPTLGQHTRDVMIDLLGFTAEETDALEADGAIG